MLQTLMVKLEPTEKHHELLLDTMHRFNEACNAIAEVVFEMHSASKLKIHKATYYDIRAKYGLSSQLTVRAISKVCEDYKRDTSIKPEFRPDGAIVYDERIHSWKGLENVSLITLEDLTGIRNRTTVSKAQRRDHEFWSFGQLREFITYKAAIAGVPLVFVDPAYTSQECPICRSVSSPTVLLETNSRVPAVASLVQQIPLQLRTSELG
jgi:IS605 OrfB family transposase